MSSRLSPSFSLSLRQMRSGFASWAVSMSFSPVSKYAHEYTNRLSSQLPHRVSGSGACPSGDPESRCHHSPADRLPVAFAIGAPRAPEGPASVGVWRGDRPTPWLSRGSLHVEVVAKVGFAQREIRGRQEHLPERPWPVQHQGEAGLKACTRHFQRPVPEPQRKRAHRWRAEKILEYRKGNGFARGSGNLCRLRWRHAQDHPIVLTTNSYRAPSEAHCTPDGQ